MTRDQLEHIIRAAAAITHQYEFYIVGSQSILGAHPHPPAQFTVSAEVDIYPVSTPELADRIDVLLGEGSHFHNTYGYYAEGVGPQTSRLPIGWETRLHRVQSVNTEGYVGLCLDVPDLFMAKAFAGREKDREFCMGLFQHAFVTLEQVEVLVPDMGLASPEQRKLLARIRRWHRQV